MSSNRHQTLPVITLRYSQDEVSGVLSWTLEVSDGDNHAAPVQINPETAAGIAEIIDVALPTPLVVGSDPTSAQRIVRSAHVQTLAAQLAAAEADLRATAPARSSAVQREAAPARPTHRPAAAPAAAPAADVEPAARPARRGAAKRAVALVPPVVDGPIAGEPIEGAAPEKEAPPAEVEPQQEFRDAPEFLGRTNHLVVPAVEEF